MKYEVVGEPGGMRTSLFASVRLPELVRKAAGGGGGGGGVTEHNRVIFTRDLGGDFARVRALLFSPILFTVFSISRLSEGSPPTPGGWEGAGVTLRDAPPA